MAEQFLNTAEVGASLEQMGREAVAQSVRRDPTAGREIEPEALDKTLDIP